MRYPASEKLEIIRLVEHSHLPAKQTLDRLGIARPTFYRWYDLYLRFGEDVLEDRRPGPRRAWNRIPDDVQGQILEMALERCELSPRELAVTFTDEQRYFISEASVYRLLKAHDLITNPNFIVMKAASEFKDKTIAPNQLWQTDFRSLDGVGSIYRLCALRMSPRRWIWRWKPLVVRLPASSTDHACYRITAPATSRVNWLTTSKPTA
mgnify:CR=1 FL=1